MALTGNIFQRHRSSPEDLVNDFGEVAPFTFRLLAKIYRCVCVCVTFVFSRIYQFVL